MAKLSPRGIDLRFMDIHTNKGIWDPKVNISFSEMNMRIKNIIFGRSWQDAARVIVSKGYSIDKLKVAEVGCGTGTTALTFALLGASVTLIDFNQKMLGLAKGLYQMYGCQAEFINADCLHRPEDNLKGSFDLVISSGLLEHFTGNARELCLKYHKDLLKTEGFALIMVPNYFCPWYQFVRLFRILTKTWGIDVEIPFSTRELNFISKKAGFRSYYVISSGDLLGDLRFYARGFLSAIGDIMPGSIKTIIRGWKLAFIAKKNDNQDTSDKIRVYCRDRLLVINDQSSRKPARAGLADQFNSVLTLLAFK